MKSSVGADRVTRITRQLFELRRHEEKPKRALANLNAGIAEQDWVRQV
jgi:hypothetical protein